MKASRRTQPYRKGARQPGPTLAAMLKGATATGYNPADAMRAAQKQNRSAQRRGGLAKRLASARRSTLRR